MLKKRKVLWSRVFVFFVIVFIVIFSATYLVIGVYDKDRVSQLPKGVVGYWSFDGGNVVVWDSSLLQNHGLKIGGVVIENGHAYFDGINDKIKIDDNDAYSISTTRGLSVSFWVRVDDFNFSNTYNDYVNFLGKGDSFWPVPNQEWGFRVYDDKHTSRAKSFDFYVFNITGGLGTGSQVMDASESEWVHIVGTTNGVNTYIYENGVLVDFDPYSRFHINVSNGDSPLYFGWRDDSGGYFRGYLDEVVIFDRNLSESEVVDIYDLQKDKVKMGR